VAQDAVVNLEDGPYVVGRETVQEHWACGWGRLSACPARSPCEHLDSAIEPEGVPVGEAAEPHGVVVGAAPVYFRAKDPAIPSPGGVVRFDQHFVR